MTQKSKQKTRKAVTKRFKLTAGGKVMHRGHGVRHLRTKKSNRRLRAQAIPREVVGRMKKKVLQMMGE
jgi:large subunit ribosomal protein L35